MRTEVKRHVLHVLHEHQIRYALLVGDPQLAAIFDDPEIVGMIDNAPDHMLDNMLRRNAEKSMMFGWDSSLAPYEDHDAVDHT